MHLFRESAACLFIGTQGVVYLFFKVLFLIANRKLTNVVSNYPLPILPCQPHLPHGEAYHLEPE
ncbi:MAG: hypothetical protein ACI8V2_002470 [Candidatus Latescibacterota bacterium]|jgi:hypothetical protein